MNLVINDFLGDAAFTGWDETEPMRKTYEWVTDKVSFDSRKEQRNQILSQPVRHWFPNWDVIDSATREKAIELYQRAKGRFDTFLYKDRRDFLADEITIATDGTTLTYQLIQEYYDGETEGWDEIKKDIVPGGTFAPVVTHNIDGAQTEDPAPGANEYSLDDQTGIMTWSGGNEPSAGVLTCTFQFYFRVRFDSDQYIDLQTTPTPLWKLSNLHLVEVLS